jgi:nucleoid-associated protein YgaU
MEILPVKAGNSPKERRIHVNMKSKMVAAAAVALAVIVGGVAMWANSRSTAKAPEQQEATLRHEEGSTAAAVTPEKKDAAEAAAGEATLPATSTSVTTDNAGATVPESHIVQPGETLRSIAEHYYHNKAYSGDIEAFNNLDDPDHIKPGDKLMLPKLDSQPSH